MSHADNAPGWAPGCPYEYHQPIIEPAHRDEPRLTIVEPIIGPREVRPRENLFGPAQVQAPLRQRLSSLGRVAGDAHLIIVDTFNATVNPDRTRPQMLANGSHQRPRADLSARGRGALNRVRGSAARGRALYASRRAACVCWATTCVALISAFLDSMAMLSRAIG